ncbi:MAG TPA: sulfatase-like hydrolase/transferase [Spirochaetia bacterium]|nr:sulfatase-like hydrolase/transferase [Spirochaetia bacterium]
MPKKKPPNILWICTDQQRFDTIRSQGNPHINTPNLDRLAEEGVVFSHAYCQNPVCTPSRGSFLTGRYPRTTRLRQNGQKIPADELLVTKVLADSGYTCGLAGKLHLAPCDGRAEERIDDGYREFHWSHGPFPKWKENEYIQWLEGQGKEWKDVYPFSPEISARLGPEGLSPDGRVAWAGVPAEYHQSTWCTDRALEFMSRHDGSPWLFSVNPFDPHHPFDPPDDFLKRYDPDRLPSPVYREGELDGKPVFQLRDHRGAYGGSGVSFSRTDDRQHREIKAAYYAMIELVDHNVGRLLDALEASGERENTLVIFMSDHGEMLGDHGIFLKGPYMYEPMVRVPLIVSWPGTFEAGLKSDALVELVDIAPTLLEAAGVDVPPSVQGRSLYSICAGESSAHVHRETVYSEYYNSLVTHRDPVPYVTMVRGRRFKIVCYSGLGTGELYDLANDPQEQENLWGSSDLADVKVEYLLKCLDASVFAMDPLPLRTGAY